MGAVAGLVASLGYAAAFLSAVRGLQLGPGSCTCILQ